MEQDLALKIAVSKSISSAGDNLGMISPLVI